jgi:phosphate transport system substrate-binding protein
VEVKVGEGAAVNWPVGASGKGNEGVAAFVGRLPNSIGYINAYVQTEQDGLCPAAQFDEYLCERTTPASKPLQRVADWAKTLRDRQPNGMRITGATFILMRKCRTTSTNHSRFEVFLNGPTRAATRLLTTWTTMPMPATVKTAIEKSGPRSRTRLAKLFNKYERILSAPRLRLSSVSSTLPANSAAFVRGGRA